MKRVLNKLALPLLLGLAVSAYALTDKQRAEVEERIKPAGQVCLEGDSSCGTAVASADGSGSGKSAKEVYDTYCMACHTTGAAGAPKLGDAGAWKKRLEAGIDQVYANAIKGINGMPAKGLCSSCSDEDIEVTVDYIIDNSQ